MDRDSALRRFVSTSPEVLGGESVFTGTRVPVGNLIDYLEAGDTVDDFLDAFPSVSREQATAAIEAERGDQIRKSKT